MKTPWAVILCKFNDEDTEPFPLQYYRDLFTTDDQGSPWNMVKFFGDCSHGNVDLTGSQVFGWYQLDKSVADYNNLGQGARAQLIQWARDLATAQGVDLSPFFSTVVCTNLWSDIGAAIGFGAVAQGKTPTPAALGQEMGHIYGLAHSRKDGTTTDYTDPWDMMSGFSDLWTSDPEFNAIGPAFNAWNMRGRGWLDESRVWKPPQQNFDETITLRPLPRHDLPGLLAAELPGGFLVEFRAKDGWDGGIPRSAVLVHRWDGVHSYLMDGNSGVPDLVAGDGFGDTIPSPLPTSVRRVDVLSIDDSHATLRVQYREAHDPVLDGRAIDPWYLILAPRAYRLWLEKNHPHVPRIADIQAVLRAMSPEDQRASLARARQLGEVAAAMAEAAVEVHAPARPALDPRSPNRR